MTQLTEEQIRAKSKEKVDKIRALCKELQIEISAKQKLDPMSMCLENIVTFTDMENYPIMESAPTPGEAEEATVIPENVPPAETPAETPAEETPNVETPAL